jgi:hypothetical protein
MSLEGNKACPPPFLYSQSLFFIFLCFLPNPNAIFGARTVRDEILIGVRMQKRRMQFEEVSSSLSEATFLKVEIAYNHLEL